MIYNFLKYITDILTDNSEDSDLIAALTVNGYGGKLNAPSLVLNDTGGIPSHLQDRTDKTVQILCRHSDINVCYQWINTVYGYLKNFFHVTLPAITVKGVTYPELKAWQISPIQSPSYIGTDSSGQHIYTFNVKVTIS